MEQNVICCPSCEKQLRIPVMEKMIRVSCPCGNKFECKSGNVLMRTNNSFPKMNEKEFREALMRAITSKNVKEVKLLLVCKPNVNFSYREEVIITGRTFYMDDFAFSPLEKAVVTGNVEIVELLLDAGANVNIGEDGYTPLNEAACNGYTDIVELLIDAGAEVNTYKKTGETPLYGATMWGYTDTVRLLLAAGAVANPVEFSTGYTPLIHAAFSGRPNIVKLLLEAGAEKNKMDNKGKTPLKWAIDEQHADVVELLEKD